MEVTTTMLLFRRDDGLSDAEAHRRLEALRAQCLTGGCHEATLLSIPESSAPGFADPQPTHAIWQAWYSEGLYRQWRETLRAPDGVALVSVLEFVTLRPDSL